MADDHSRLADALAGNGAVPANFDMERLRVQRSALVDKRSNAVSWHAPAVAMAVGDRLTALFDEYAAAVPKPAGGSANDVAAFVDYLRAHRVLAGSRRRPRLRS